MKRIGRPHTSQYRNQVTNLSRHFHKTIWLQDNSKMSTGTNQTRIKIPITKSSLARFAALSTLAIPHSSFGYQTISARTVGFGKSLPKFGRQVYTPSPLRIRNEQFEQRHSWNHAFVSLHSTAVPADSSAVETTSMIDPNNDNKNGEEAVELVQAMTAEEKVAASAIALDFIPSPDGNGGVMALEILEGDVAAPTGISLDISLEVSEEDSLEISRGLAMDSPPVIDKTNSSKEAIAAEVKEQLSSTGMFSDTKSKAQAKDSSARGQQGDDFTGKAVLFPDGKKGVVIAQRPPIAFVACDFGSFHIPSDKNQVVSILQSRSSVEVHDNLIGNIWDRNLSPVSTHVNESKKNSLPFASRAIFAPIPQVKDIALIDSPMLTGIAMVDALAPIGKGQNMLLIGHGKGNDVGQRDLAIEALKAQVGDHENNADKRGTKCVYGITNPDPMERAEVIKSLKEAGVLDKIVVITAGYDTTSNKESVDWKNSPAISADAVTVAATACAVGEAFALARGDDSLVIIDDIDHHKSFWDWTTRVLVDIYGVDSVVKDDIEGGASSEMRAFYSSIIQRAGKFKENRGGGSVSLVMLSNLPGSKVEHDDEVIFKLEDFENTSEKVMQRIRILVDRNIPLTSKNLKKIQIPIPTDIELDSERKRLSALNHVDDLISMSDGQIWLDDNLHANGQRPALDPQRSITRVGVGADTDSRADAPAMRGLTGGLRFDFQQAASLDGAGANSGAERQIRKRDAYLLSMHQDKGDSRTLSENCVALLAASTGSLDAVVKNGGLAGTEKGRSALKGLFDHVWDIAADSMKNIDETLDLTPSDRATLESSINDYFS
mmetsp:Transcript_14766/g.21091  ORF Transcript_14766/g.21091 Transcript_14766/m.21091 type:complete len:831 (+) Transcript_14766:26-2518(+)